MTTHRDCYCEIDPRECPVHFSDEDVLTVIEAVHPIFTGTRIPRRVLTALRDAGYTVVRS